MCAILDLETKPFDNSATTELVLVSLGNSMAKSLSSQGDAETVGPKGIIKKLEYVKIITKALYCLGYNRTGDLIQQESGIELHSSEVLLFIQQVQGGEWDKSLAKLHTIGLGESILKSASFLILEQKLFELLEEGKQMDALNTLRKEIVPFSMNVERVHELSLNIISPSPTMALSSDSRLKLTNKLQNLLPMEVMVPERRLELLLEQALDAQRLSCALHNTLDREMSLLTDHQCGISQIPSQTLQVLQAHVDEVWFVQFSHDGRYLASSSKDKLAVIWEAKDDNQFVIKHQLIGHQQPVVMVSWSPDDSELLTCGLKEVIRRWDANSGECLLVYERPGEGLISCGWSPEAWVYGITGSRICIWDLNGKESELMEGHRISDMVMIDDRKIITTFKDTAIILLDKNSQCKWVIQEGQVITSMSLSEDNKWLLVNLADQAIHLWRIEDSVQLISKYKGHTRTRYLIRSCFGGLDQAFVASGSEDSQVYIWLKATGELLSALPGHSGAVSCVSWNPRNPQMLASASDDGTIRIWVSFA